MHRVVTIALTHITSPSSLGHKSSPPAARTTVVATETDVSRARRQHHQRRTAVHPAQRSRLAKTKSKDMMDVVHLDWDITKE